MINKLLQIYTNFVLFFNTSFNVFLVMAVILSLLIGENLQLGGKILSLDGVLLPI